MPGYFANYDGAAVSLIMGGTSFSAPTAPTSGQRLAVGAGNTIVGLPGWATWVPTITCGGSMTIASVVIRHARYRLDALGKTCDISIAIEGTLEGTASDSIYATFPTGVDVAAAYSYSVGWRYDTSTGGAAGVCIPTPSSGLRFMKIAGSGNWALGAALVYHSIPALEIV